jgi:hypothetical protein
MVNVDVNENSVETSQDLFANRLKRSRKRNVGSHRENCFVVDLKQKNRLFLNSWFEKKESFIFNLFKNVSQSEKDNNCLWQDNAIKVVISIV